MKTVRCALLTIVALMLSLSLQAQQVGATLTYVKVKPGQVNSYIELEKSTQKLHQDRVEKGIITRWALYRKLYQGSGDSYNYIIVQLNDDFKKTENPFPAELIDQHYTEEEQAEYWKTAPPLREFVKREYYDNVSATELSHPYKYLRFIRYYVPGEQRGLFEKQRKEIVKPLFEEVVKREINAGWSLWRKDPFDKKFQYVGVNTYAEFGQWKDGLGMDEIFKQTFPDKNFEETRSEVFGTRTHVSAEYWELVLETEPAE